MLANLAKRIFGSANQRALASYERVVQAVNGLEEWARGHARDTPAARLRDGSH